MIGNRSFLNPRVLVEVQEETIALRHLQALQAILNLLEVLASLLGDPALAEAPQSMERLLRKEGTTLKVLTGEVLEEQAYMEIRMIEVLASLLDLEIPVQTHLHRVLEHPEDHPRTKDRKTSLHQAPESRALPSQVEEVMKEVLEVKVVLEDVQNQVNPEV